MRIVAAAAALLLAGVSASAAIILNVSAGPDFVASESNTASFDLLTPGLVHLDFAPSQGPQQNETFGCSVYPLDGSHCNGLFGASIVLVRLGDPNPVLFRGLGASYIHDVFGVITSGDEFGCALDMDGCQAVLSPGSYVLSAAVDLSISGRNGGIPAPVMRTVVAQLSFDSGDPIQAPEPRPSILIYTATALALLSRRARQPHPSPRNPNDMSNRG